MYTEEQKYDLYRILGGKHFIYHIRVFYIIDVGESILNSMLDGSYVQQIKPIPIFSDETVLYSEIVRTQRMGKLNVIINIVKLENVPLYKHYSGYSPVETFYWSVECIQKNRE